MSEKDHPLRFPLRPCCGARQMSSATAATHSPPLTPPPAAVGSFPMRKVLGDSLHTFSSVRKYERPLRTEWLLSTRRLRRSFDSQKLAQDDMEKRIATSGVCPLRNDMNNRMCRLRNDTECGSAQKKERLPSPLLILLYFTFYSMPCVSSRSRTV